MSALLEGNTAIRLNMLMNYYTVQTSLSYAVKIDIFLATLFLFDLLKIFAKKQSYFLIRHGIPEGKGNYIHGNTWKLNQCTRLSTDQQEFLSIDTQVLIQLMPDLV